MKSRARWIHTYKGKDHVPQYLEGEVTGHGNGNGKVYLKRITGATYDLDAHHLEPV